VAGSTLQEAAMKIVIQGRGINVRDSLKEYIEQELNRLDRLYPRIVDAGVVLEGKLHQKEVMIKVNVPDQLLMATETADKFDEHPADRS
jgi:ribosomal subunit interface protein